MPDLNTTARIRGYRAGVSFDAERDRKVGGQGIVKAFENSPTTFSATGFCFFLRNDTKRARSDPTGPAGFPASPGSPDPKHDEVSSTNIPIYG